MFRHAPSDLDMSLGWTGGAFLVLDLTVASASRPRRVAFVATGDAPDDVSGPSQTMYGVINGATAPAPSNATSGVSNGLPDKSTRSVAVH